MFGIFLLLMCFIKTTQQGDNSESFQTLTRPKRHPENHCVLPGHPTNGEFKIFGHEQEPYLPNSNVTLSTIIDLTCTNGTVTETGGLFRAICYQGKWKSSISEVQGCVRRCPQVETERENMFVICKHTNARINCRNPIEGTILEVVCNPFYEYTRLQSNITCRDGSWDSEIAHCQPECGKKRVLAEQLIVGGSTSKASEYPWIAAVYGSNMQFKAGATVISRHFVLTVAHAFKTESGDLLDKSNFIVTAGKYYRDFKDKRDEYMQSSRVKRLYISKSFGGFSQNLIGDLAILTLKDPFTFTEYVQPVCIDWTNELESYDLKKGNKGVFAGWGFTQGSGDLARELQILEVPYQSTGTCALLQEINKTFYTYDKFCAGYVDNHSGVCSGDNGGGLYFQHPDNKFYIRGILSYAPSNGNGCNPNVPALYTKISTYLKEIEEEVKRIV